MKQEQQQAEVIPMAIHRMLKLKRNSQLKIRSFVVSNLQVVALIIVVFVITVV
jgi:hypothetical protein